MAEGKNGVIIYKDWITTFEDLEDDEAGRLSKHLFRYINDLDPEPPDRLTKLVFEPLKRQLKADLTKWRVVCDRNYHNGLKGGRPKRGVEHDSTETQKTQSVILGFQDNPENPIQILDTEDNNSIEIPISHTSKKSKETRESEFRQSLKPYESKYGLPMVEAFFQYWTESNQGGIKMRFEMQKVFDVSKRLATWASKDYNQKNNSNGTNQQRTHRQGDRIDPNDESLFCKLNR